MDEIARQINPYEAPSGRVEDVPRESSGYLLASRGRRLGAVFFDGLTYSIGVLIAFILIGAPDLADAGWLVLAYGLALPVLAVNLYFLARDGQSLGKKIARIRIVRKDGSRARLGRILILRMLAPFVVGLIPILGVIFNLADSLAIFTEARRCIHDYMADTVVIQAV